jgi:Tfp pilus assembly protein PilF
LTASGECSNCSTRLLPAIFRREVALLITLYLCTVPLFLVTRSVAARNRNLNIETAEAWYAKGQEQLKAGDLAEAISSLRKAATSDHDDPRHVLALATALAAANHDEEARQMLIQVRAATPENGEINLQLARLSARDRGEQETVRYYHYALYGVWPDAEMAIRRRSVRSELVHFLLKTGDQARALSELLILSSDIPDTPEAHNELGSLFLDAMDWQRAQDQFSRTLNLDRKNGPALLGAGKAAFNLADYRNASRYLRDASQLGFEDSGGDAMKNTAQFVLSADPLAAGVRTEERIRRLTESLNLASQRMQTCLSVISHPGIEALRMLERELQEGLKTRYRNANLRQDAEGFQSGVELIFRIEMVLGQRACPGDSLEHRALVLIAKKHGAAK